MGKHLFRSSPPPEKPTAHLSLAESAVQECMSNINTVISKWTSPAASSSDDFLFSTNSRREAEEFVTAVRHLQSTMHRLVSVNPSSEKLIYAQNLMQSAMKLLESEFHRVLKANREYLDPECVSVRSYRSSRFSTSTTTSVSDSEDESSYEENADEEHRFSGGDSDAMDDLKMIADCMISTGYAKECVRVYKTVRKSIVDETLHNLQMERFNLHQVQKMDWEILESKIKTWLKAVKLAVRKLFFGERILADHVFSSSGLIVESSFTEITQEGALILFTFPEYASKIKKLTPEKMFRFLDMYEALANLYVEIESIFYFESAAAVRSQVINSLARLGDATRLMMTDFESAIQKETSKTPIIGGGVHPLTRYVMNYLSFLADYSDSIAAIFENWKLSVPTPLPDSLYISGGDEANPEDLYSSPVSVRIAWVILLTLCKIDGKAQPYKDVALSYLFLANNLQYVVVKVRSSTLKVLLGDDWVFRHEEKVKLYADKFEKLAWGRVLDLLPEIPTDEISPEEAKVLVARFNDEFETSYRKQTSWVIPDPKLRDQIKITLSQKLMLVCTEFYRMNRFAYGMVGDNEAISRYTPEDIGNYLSDLYFGSRGSGSVSTAGGSGSGSGSGTGSSSTGKARGGRSSH
ncbi:putative exocyst complex component Exo70, cullin repeat-like-containing domain superfamily [Arabidopsis thaliana]|uniref:Exocyst subunit Exo70 family protein n=2 Tax=Arabidopsis TaxID=3701 RepID=A0A178UTM8_ARATH|nr:Exocyst complex component Exo70 [Arabidopsis thaliana x Arabidopsis arenosa]OAO96101.1 EXO70H7 [Arabidopsis thaliana]